MKKTVKSLIIAASVAAIAGIGAVSFAAWNTGATNSTAKTDPIDLGVVTVNGGFVKTGEDTYEALTTTDSALVPYDQGTGTRALVFVIPDYQVVKDKAYTLTLTTDKLQAKFKYDIADDAVTGPADSDEFADWGTAAGTAIDYTAPTATGTVTGKKMTVILDSSALEDMGASITFTLTFAEAA